MFLFLVLIKGMEGVEVSSRFPCVTPGVWEHSSKVVEFNAELHSSKVVEFNACRVFVDD